jgi:hypothetical protein
VESIFGKEGDDIGGKFLAGVELDEGALTVDPLEAGKQGEAAEERVVLEALNVKFEQGGRGDVGGLEEICERRDGDRGGGDFGGAGEEGSLRGGDRQEGGGVVAGGDVYGAGFGGGTDGGWMESDLGVVGEEAAEDGGGSWERFEGDDAGAGRPVTRGESELSAVSADVDDGGERARENGAMFDAGEDAVLECGAREASRAGTGWCESMIEVRSGCDEGVADSCVWN